MTMIKKKNVIGTFSINWFFNQFKINTKKYKQIIKKILSIDDLEKKKKKKKKLKKKNKKKKNKKIVTKEDVEKKKKKIRNLAQKKWVIRIRNISKHLELHEKQK